MTLPELIEAEARTRGFAFERLNTVQDATVYAVADRTHCGAVIVPHWQARQAVDLPGVVSARFNMVKWAPLQ